MITIQKVYQRGGLVEGFAVIDSNNPDCFLVTYVDYELCEKLNKVIQFRNMPYPVNESMGWIWGDVIKVVAE